VPLAGSREIYFLTGFSANKSGEAVFHFTEANIFVADLVQRRLGKAGHLNQFLVFFVVQIALEEIDRIDVLVLVKHFVVQVRAS
jgi:hypothetical protein